LEGLLHTLRLKFLIKGVDEIWIFTQNFDLSAKLGFLPKIRIFGENLFFFGPKFGFFSKTSIFDENWDF